jgi:hypothetical protein
MTAARRTRRARGGLAAIAYLSAVGCTRPPPDEVAPSAAAAAAVDAPPAPTLDSSTPGWESRHWYAYQLSLTTAVAMGAGASAFDFDLTGTVQVTPTEVTPEGVTLYLALANPKIASRVVGSQSALDKVAAQIASTGCFVSLSGGRTTALYTPRELSTIAVNIYREIGSGLQFAHTAHATARYTAREYDTTGEYVAEYVFEASQNVWHKHKQQYVAILAAKTAPANAPGRVVPQIDASSCDVRLTPDGRPETVTSRESVTITGAQQPVRSTTSFALAGVRDDAAHGEPPDWHGLMSAMQRTAADEPYGPPAPIDALDDARIKGVTFDKAVAALERIEADKRATPRPSGASLAADDKSQEQATADASRMFIALAAIFREQPRTIVKAVEKIRAKSVASDTLISALSSASSPAAQSALVDLSNAKTTDPITRNRIMLALSRTPRPDKTSIDALKGLLKNDPYSEQALFGLGTFCRRLRDLGEVSGADDIGALLLDRLATATALLDRLTVLRAIGNSGYAPAIPKVTPALNDSQEIVRVVAVGALQSMQDPQVDEIIADRIRTDPASDVRISALGAAKVRQPTDALARAVESAASDATDAHVRYRAVELLALWMPARPDVRSTLQKVAKNDGEMRVRDRAQGAL